MAEGSRHEMEIETVAEVQAVHREAVKVCFFEDERLVSISQSGSYHDYQSITWPVEKTPAIIAALQRIADAEVPHG